MSAHFTGNAGLYFREIGGLMFVKNLANSSEHSMVKEAALYTLGAIAEQNGKIWKLYFTVLSILFYFNKLLKYNFRIKFFTCLDSFIHVFYLN